MITLEQWHTIRHLAAIGHSRREIARILGIARRTVARALEEEALPQYERAPAMQQTLAGFQLVVEQGLSRGLSGVRLLAAVRQSGYSGSDATFYRWLAEVREGLARRGSCCRFETGPAEQAQFDWSPYLLQIGGNVEPVTLFSLVLGYSRRVHWYPSLSERQDSVLDALEAGLRHFGGSCRFVLIDNAKSMVLRHRGSEVRWNACFLSLCGHYRIQPIAATPAHPQTKGKVENPFRVIEGRLLRGGEWPDWAALERGLAQFEATWERRIHQTTKVAPLVRFEEERSALLPLPRTPFVGCPAHLRHVGNDSLFSYGGVRYCVPVERGLRQVRVRTLQGRELLVYDLAGALVIRHALLPAGSPPVLSPECYQAHKKRRQAAFCALLTELRKRFERSPVVEAYIQALLTHHPNRPERPLARVLELLSAAPDTAALAALADAASYNLPDQASVAQLLARHLRGNHQPGPEPAPLPHAAEPLPKLDIERPLQTYAQQLPEATAEDARRRRDDL